MDTKQLKKLRRSELLGMLLQRSKELEKIQEELEIERAAHKNTRDTLDSQRIAIEESGSIAEATVRISGIMEEAQQAADQYLERVKEQAREEKAALEAERAELEAGWAELENARAELEAERQALTEAQDVLKQEQIVQAAVRDIREED